MFTNLPRKKEFACTINMGSIRCVENILSVDN